MNKTFILGNTRQELIHCWPEAPKEVKYLRDPHRHELHISWEIEVKHDDRELEIITVKKVVEQWYKVSEFPLRISCEQIATRLASYLTATYGRRKMAITIMEDGENGSKYFTE